MTLKGPATTQATLESVPVFAQMKVIMRSAGNLGNVAPMIIVPGSNDPHPDIPASEALNVGADRIYVMFESGNVTNEARKGRRDQQGLKGRSLPAGAKARSVNPGMILAGVTGK
ncbi:uncharacterized protein STEHIDRAFT_114039 [Stereum hirsutum FP-91666 SS1]|uniref:uncharacterized protein n=1 Tax=Stereum hirsutum (strain FP-91666) TaxID=721885 RepID=UPI00044496B8|nr:uncharacterized protein STEHIDRAFT_114039 [Stereum hirsutum FP-91666 SS1]EIM82985.1 hypothetical protein STEHIDRAFT_114039 [Stereum hirsutum FP-91666 SS1]